MQWFPSVEPIFWKILTIKGGLKCKIYGNTPEWYIKIPVDLEIQEVTLSLSPHIIHPTLFHNILSSSIFYFIAYLVCLIFMLSSFPFFWIWRKMGCLLLSFLVVKHSLIPNKEYKLDLFNPPPPPPLYSWLNTMWTDIRNSNVWMYTHDLNMTLWCAHKWCAMSKMEYTIIKIKLDTTNDKKLNAV